MSQDTNHVVIVGRLTRDTQLSYTNGGTAVCKFSIANNQRRKKGEQYVDEASFFDVTYFGKGAEAVNQYLLKGKQILVEGKLHQDRWEQEGVQRSKVAIVADGVQLFGGGRAEGAPSQSAKSTDNFEDEVPFN